MTDLFLPPLGRLPWIDVVLLAWFGLTALSVAYVAWDAYRNNPQLTVMKWGWVLVTSYLGPVGLFLYIMSCKEPFPGTHEAFIQPAWKQALRVCAEPCQRWAPRRVARWQPSVGRQSH